MQGYNPMTPEQRRQDEWVAQNITRPKRWHGSEDWKTYNQSPGKIRFLADDPNKHFEEEA